MREYKKITHFFLDFAASSFEATNFLSNEVHLMHLFPIFGFPVKYLRIILKAR